MRGNAQMVSTPFLPLPREVQTQLIDPITQQKQTETKALLNVSPRNVFNVWQLASAGVIVQRFQRRVGMAAEECARLLRVFLRQDRTGGVKQRTARRERAPRRVEQPCVAAGPRSDDVHRLPVEQHKQVRDHFAHMTIHGVLHLLGYDHERSPADARRFPAFKEELSAIGRLVPWIATRFSALFRPGS